MQAKLRRVVAQALWSILGAVVVTAGMLIFVVVRLGAGRPVDNTGDWVAQAGLILGGIQAFLALVLALLTGFYAVVTHRTLGELRLAREAEAERFAIQGHRDLQREARTALGRLMAGMNQATSHASRLVVLVQHRWMAGRLGRLLSVQERLELSVAEVATAMNELAYLNEDLADRAGTFLDAMLELESAAVAGAPSEEIQGIARRLREIRQDVTRLVVEQSQPSSGSGLSMSHGPHRAVAPAIAGAAMVAPSAEGGPRDGQAADYSAARAACVNVGTGRALVSE